MAFNEASWLHLLGLADLIMSLTLEAEDLLKALFQKKKKKPLGELTQVSIHKQHAFPTLQWIKFDLVCKCADL